MISTKKPLIFGIVLKNWLDVHNCLNFKSSFFYPVRAGLENQWLNITRSDLISGNDKDRRAEAQYLFTEDYLSVICGNAPANLHWGADANGLLGGYAAVSTQNGRRDFMKAYIFLNKFTLNAPTEGNRNAGIDRLINLISQKERDSA